MSKYYGNINEDDTVELTFNTFDSAGASVTVTDFASTDVHVHKDAGLTQTNAGVTIIINYDGVTGNHMIIIDTSADVFYATGSNYEVRVEGITVDTQTINAFVGSFSIENRFMRGTDSAATETKQDAGDTVRDRIAAIQESDKVFVPAAGTLTYNTKGTSTAILKKDLKDPAGAAVDSTEDIIAAEVDTTP